MTIGPLIQILNVLEIYNQKNTPHYFSVRNSHKYFVRFSSSSSQAHCWRNVSLKLCLSILCSLRPLPSDSFYVIPASISIKASELGRLSRIFFVHLLSLIFFNERVHCGEFIVVEEFYQCVPSIIFTSQSMIARSCFSIIHLDTYFWLNSLISKIYGDFPVVQVLKTFSQKLSILSSVWSLVGAYACKILTVCCWLI